MDILDTWEQVRSVRSPLRHFPGPRLKLYGFFTFMTNRLQVELTSNAESHFLVLQRFRSAIVLWESGVAGVGLSCHHCGVACGTADAARRFHGPVPASPSRSGVHPERDEEFWLFLLSLESLCPQYSIDYFTVPFEKHLEIMPARGHLGDRDSKRWPKDPQVFGLGIPGPAPTTWLHVIWSSAGAPGNGRLLNASTFPKLLSGQYFSL